MMAAKRSQYRPKPNALEEKQRKLKEKIMQRNKKKSQKVAETGEMEERGPKMSEF